MRGSRASPATSQASLFLSPRSRIWRAHLARFPKVAPAISCGLCLGDRRAAGRCASKVLGAPTRCSAKRNLQLAVHERLCTEVNDVSDVELVDENVKVTGDALQCEILELVLDDPRRRQEGARGRRRALVHDTRDGLTVNWNGDYPGGVSVFGPVRVVSRDLELDHPSRRGSDHADRPRRALVHDAQDGLTINFRGDYPGGVTVHGALRIRHNGRTVDVYERIADLETTVRELTRRLEELEA